jgi:hypothetical protein
MLISHVCRLMNYARLFSTQLLAVLAGAAGLAMLLFKSTRRLGFKLVAGSIVGFIAFGTVGPDLDGDARSQGFASYTDLSRAKRHSISDPGTWKAKAAELDAEAKRKSEENDREAKLKVKLAGVITGSGLAANDSCARWKNVQICRYQPADGFPDYLFYKVQPKPRDGCLNGIERWARENDIDTNWISISALFGVTNRCEFSQVPIRMRYLFNSKPAGSTAAR